METRVYVANVENYEFNDSPRSWDYERFMSEAEIQGGVYTLNGFQEAFNDETVNSSVEFIRFIKVETWE